MRSWLGLVLAPAIALAAQSVMYALVTPSCSEQVRVTMHLVAAVALALSAALGVLSFGESSLRQGEGASPDDDRAQAPAPRRFLADMATAVAALSCLVIVGMWFGLWVLSPCDLF